VGRRRADHSGPFSGRRLPSADRSTSGLRSPYGLVDPPDARPMLCWRARTANGNAACSREIGVRTLGGPSPRRRCAARFFRTLSRGSALPVDDRLDLGADRDQRVARSGEAIELVLRFALGRLDHGIVPATGEKDTVGAWESRSPSGRLATSDSSMPLACFSGRRSKIISCATRPFGQPCSRAPGSTARGAPFR